MSEHVKVPKGHEQIGYGWSSDGSHTPGNDFHEIEVVISTANNRYRCAIAEVIGNDQGTYDQIYNRRDVIGRGDTIQEAVEDATNKSHGTEIDKDMMFSALSRAEDSAENLAEEHDQDADAKPTAEDRATAYRLLAQEMADLLETINDDLTSCKNMDSYEEGYELVEKFHALVEKFNPTEEED